MEENPSPTIFDIIDPSTAVSADSIFVMSVTEFKTKILTAFENENRVLFSADSQVPYDECLYKF